MAVSPWGDAL
ncbi:unnamed protein product, partial [Rotaria sp. Silwood2]